MRLECRSGPCQLALPTAANFYYPPFCWLRVLRVHLPAGVAPARPGLAQNDSDVAHAAARDCGCEIATCLEVEPGGSY